jgi:hypothetical protein
MGGEWDYGATPLNDMNYYHPDAQNYNPGDNMTFFPNGHPSQNIPTPHRLNYNNDNSTSMNNLNTRDSVQSNINSQNPLIQGPGTGQLPSLREDTISRMTYKEGEEIENTVSPRMQKRANTTTCRQSTDRRTRHMIDRFT